MRLLDPLVEQLFRFIQFRRRAALRLCPARLM